MHSVSNRSKVNSNNAGHYNRIDRSIDEATDRNANRTVIIGPRDDHRAPAPTATPTLRSRLAGGSSAATGIALRVYIRDEGDNTTMVGMAASRDTLLALLEAGFMSADLVTIRGRVDGVKVDRDIDDREFDRFRDRMMA